MATQAETRQLVRGAIIVLAGFAASKNMTEYATKMPNAIKPIGFGVGIC